MYDFWARVNDLVRLWAHPSISFCECVSILQIYKNFSLHFFQKLLYNLFLNI